jgi:hypothetical protein
MITIKDHKQTDLFDPWASLSPKRRQLLEESWAGLYRKEILCELPVNAFAPYFEKDVGRPTKELYSVLSVLLLQQFLDLTDQEAIYQLAFNIQWHYALNISEESDSAKYFCEKTLWNMRNITAENNLDGLLFDRITKKLASVFNVDTDKQRIDSVHIKSNMRRLGRIGIFSNTIRKFLVNLNRHHNNFFESIDKNIVDRYFSEKALSCFSMVKPSESSKTLLDVSSDLFDLVEQFKGNEEVTNMHSYKLLQRVLKEQCNLNGTGKDRKIEVKPPKEISSDSLQNPSDPDATYSGHKGQGYQVQIMETYTDTEDENIKAKTLNLITHVAVETACQSDAHAIKPAIQSTKQRGLAPKELEADTLYGGDDNYEYAKTENMELVSPTHKTRNKKENDISVFTFSDSGHVISCPEGEKPLITKKKKTRFTQGFNPKKCAQCPFYPDCPVKRGENYYYLRYEEKVMRLAKRRAEEQTDEFKQRYRWRAGVEATMSEYNNKTGVKLLRVRGSKAVRFAAVLKAIGVNIFRATAARKARKDGSSQGAGYFSRLFQIFKEQIRKYCKSTYIFVAEAQVITNM